MDGFLKAAHGILVFLLILVEDSSGMNRKKIVRIFLLESQSDYFMWQILS